MHTPFSLVPRPPTHLLGWDFLKKCHAGIFFSQKGEIILKFDNSYQSNKPGEWNDPLTSFIWFASDSTRANTDLEILITCL